MDVMRKTTILNDTFDVCYSPDDEGWYLQRFPDHNTSQIFPTRGEAVEALRTPEAIEWG